MSPSLIEIDWAGRAVHIEHAWVSPERLGSPLLVFLHEGLGSLSMWKDFPQRLCDAVSCRGLVYSRPGYGRSTRLHGRDVAQCAEDVAAVADALGIDRFATWGVSGGGPHALATAALLSDRVVAAATLAAVAPYDSPGLDFLAGMGEDNVVEFNAALRGEEFITPLADAETLAIAGASLTQMVEQMKTVLSPVDRSVYSDEFGAFLTQYIQHGVASGSAGWVDDDLVFTKPWGFRLNSITVPLQIWQGGQDLMVPPAHGAWLAAQLPDAEFMSRPDDGHLVLVAKRLPEVHAWLADHF